jgi:capsular exopolysaccharide synthesis family protein
MDVDGSRDKLATLDTLPLVAEAYRALRTSVLLSTAEGPPKTLLFTSSAPAEGKTTTVVNTAVSFSQLGESVLIIDADLRKASAQNGHAGDRQIGLSTYLSGALEIDDTIRRLSIPGVSILPRGPLPPNPAELISSDKMKTLVRMLAERYDHILIDSAPLLYATDSVILSTLVDGVILVVRGGKSSRDAVFQSRMLLSSVGARIFGIVLNGIDFRRTYGRYGNYYPYAGYSTRKNAEGASDILLSK